MYKSLLLIFLIGIPPVVAGLPSEFANKWRKWDDTWSIDTEDIEVRKTNLRFWVQRRAAKEGSERAGNIYYYNWSGKIRINCERFSSRLERTDIGDGSPIKSKPAKIKPGDFAHSLASHFCYLTGVPGYTPEVKQSQIVKTMIYNVLNPKKRKREIDCDTRQFKNMPQCKFKKS